MNILGEKGKLALYGCHYVKEVTLTQFLGMLIFSHNQPSVLLHLGNHSMIAPVTMIQPLKYGYINLMHWLDNDSETTTNKYNKLLAYLMMTPSNGTIFRIAGPLCGLNRAPEQTVE